MQHRTYQQTLDYLYTRLPMFSRIGKAALKPDLTNTLKLCEALGNPHLAFKSVHIAGTNGKGSVSHGLAAVLQHAGYKTGLYTSPHLVDFRERIRINGQPVPEEWVIEFVEKIKPVIDEVEPSFFEITVAMAFDFFAEEDVDIAIIETGLGGRLDSTNVVTPLISVITNISYDHKELLGNTLALIAGEKAGIIKPGIPVVIGEQNEETERVFFEHSVQKHAPMYYAESLWGMVRVKQDYKYQCFRAVNQATMEIHSLRTDLLGHYQQHNMATILTVAGLLVHKGFDLPIPMVLEGVANIKHSTGLRGRWEILKEQPLIVCDVAHNPAGIAAVLDQWRQIGMHKSHIVLGFVRDKDVAEALSFFPKDAIYYFCNAHLPRALPADELAAMAYSQGLNGNTFPDVPKAVTAAILHLAPEDGLLIVGSFFIAGEVLQMF